MQLRASPANRGYKEKVRAKKKLVCLGESILDYSSYKSSSPILLNHKTKTKKEKLVTLVASL
jgi:hypothetical protein